MVKAIELQPDLLIVDLAMPEMHGVEVIRQLRRTSQMPVLIVTMHDGEAVKAGIDAGANGYVLKIEAARTLVDMVRAILNGQTKGAPFRYSA